jgi:hypothetical protein
VSKPVGSTTGLCQHVNNCSMVYARCPACHPYSAPCIFFTCTLHRQAPADTPLLLPSLCCILLSTQAPPGSQNSSSSSKKPKQVSASYLWSGLARVDVLSGPLSTSLVFYGPKALRVAALPLLAEGQEVDLEWNDDDDGTDSDDEHTTSSSSSSGGGGSGSSRRVLLCKESVAARGGLVPTTLRVPVPSIPSSACLADVAISGLPGWVSVFAPFAKQGLELRVWVPRGVEVFLRPPVPCPPPRKALGREGCGEGEGVGEADLVDIGAALDGDDDDVDWVVTRWVCLWVGRGSGGSEGRGVRVRVRVQEGGWLASSVPLLSGCMWCFSCSNCSARSCSRLISLEYCIGARQCTGPHGCH